MDIFGQNTEILSKNTGIQNIFLISNTKYRNTKYRNTEIQNTAIFGDYPKISNIFGDSPKISLYLKRTTKKILIYLLFSINCQITPILSQKVQRVK